MARKALPLAFLLVAACARSEDASVLAGSNEVRPAIEARTQPQQDEADVASGEWRETQQEQYAALEFGAAGMSSLFSLRCGDQRGLILQRHGDAPPGDLPTMLVTIGSTNRRLAVTATDDPEPMLRAALPPRDPLVEAITGAVEPIGIRIGRADPVVLPPDPAIAAFVASCTGADATTAESNAAAPAEPGNQAAAAENSAQ